MSEEKICPYINTPCIRDKCEAYSVKFCRSIIIYNREYPVYLEYNEVEEEKSVEQKYWFGLIKRIIKQKIKRKLTEFERLKPNIKKYEIVAKVDIYKPFCEKILNLECKEFFNVESYHTFIETDINNPFYLSQRSLWSFKSCNKEVQKKILNLYDESTQKYLELI